MKKITTVSSTSVFQSKGRLKIEKVPHDDMSVMSYPCDILSPCALGNVSDYHHSRRPGTVSGKIADSTILYVLSVSHLVLPITLQQLFDLRFFSRFLWIPRSFYVSFTYFFQYLVSLSIQVSQFFPPDSVDQNVRDLECQSVCFIGQIVVRFSVWASQSSLVNLTWFYWF